MDTSSCYADGPGGGNAVDDPGGDTDDPGGGFTNGLLENAEGGMEGNQ
ncbi:MAG: hypothetical protein VXZ35_09340 [Pseudomonadota bacterium]|nr:hypothetical protein [Pseudomonadota bacterium]